MAGQNLKTIIHHKKATTKKRFYFPDEIKRDPGPGTPEAPESPAGDGQPVEEGAGNDQPEAHTEQAL